MQPKKNKEEYDPARPNDYEKLIAERKKKEVEKMKALFDKEREE